MEKQRAESKLFKQKLSMARKSPFKAYIEATVGKESIWKFIKYEMITDLFGLLPGAVGYIARHLFYPSLFAEAGRGLVIGRNVVIRRPGKIKIGKNVTIDDNALIDGGVHGINISDGVTINRNCVIKAKSGIINIGENSNIGGNTVISSYSGIEIGTSVLVAGGCHISGGGYNFSDNKATMMEQGVYTKGPIEVGDDVWIAAGAIVLDGVKIGKHAIVGAGAVVVKDINENGIVAGVPARLLRSRTS